MEEMITGGNWSRWQTIAHSIPFDASSFMKVIIIQACCRLNDCLIKLSSCNKLASAFINQHSSNLIPAKVFLLWAIYFLHCEKIEHRRRKQCCKNKFKHTSSQNWEVGVVNCGL
jgi:hypothetical protein